MSEATHLQFVLSVLNHAGVIGVNWQNAAEENGIGYARNCTQKFKDTVNKYGYTFQNNKLRKTSDAAAASAPATPKPKKPARPAKVTKAAKVSRAKAKAKPATKERKIEEDDDQVDVNAQPVVENGADQK